MQNVAGGLLPLYFKAGGSLGPFLWSQVPNVVKVVGTKAMQMFALGGGGYGVWKKTKDWWNNPAGSSKLNVDSDKDIVMADRQGGITTEAVPQWNDPGFFGDRITVASGVRRTPRHVKTSTALVRTDYNHTVIPRWRGWGRRTGVTKTKKKKGKKSYVRLKRRMNRKYPWEQEWEPGQDWVYHGRTRQFGPEFTFDTNPIEQGDINDMTAEGPTGPGTVLTGPMGDPDVAPDWSDKKATGVTLPVNDGSRMGAGDVFGSDFANQHINPVPGDNTGFFNLHP